MSPSMPKPWLHPGPHIPLKQYTWPTARLTRPLIGSSVSPMPQTVSSYTYSNLHPTPYHHLCSKPYTLSQGIIYTLRPTTPHHIIIYAISPKPCLPPYPCLPPNPCLHPGWALRTLGAERRPYAAVAVHGAAHVGLRAAADPTHETGPWARQQQ